MHEVYAIAEFRHLCYEPWSLREVYAGEHEECSGCEYHTVDRAESPSYFYYGGSKNLSGRSLNIKRVNGCRCPDKH